MTVKDAIRFHSLVSQWLGEGGKPVPQSHAQNRANICLQCPKNEPRGMLEEMLAASVALTVKRQIGLKNDMKLRVDGEKKLHVCAVCNCINRLKVWTPIEFILQNTDAATLNAFPDFCWVPIEANQQ